MIDLKKMRILRFLQSKIFTELPVKRALEWFEIKEFLK